MTSSNLYCQFLMSIAEKHRVRRAICSPGSRNAPLLIAAEGCDSIETRIVVDERAAAFIALGEALVSRRPVMLICTSGTALLNYAPAVAEAYYAGIPLIVVSADRPMEWIDQDDSQTMRQFEALEHFVKKSYNLPVYCDDLGKRGDNLRWYVERSVNDAMLTAMQPKKGPVHINIQLDVPLGVTINGAGAQGRYIESVSGPTDLSVRQKLELAKTACESKVLILCGFNAPDHNLRRAIKDLSTKFDNVVIMAETLSNLGDGGELRYCMVDSLLTTLNEDELEAIRPDLVITTGGALVSRQVKDWLRKYKPKMHWSVGYNHTTVDCLQSLTSRIEADPARFLRQLSISMLTITERKQHCEIAGNSYRDTVNALRARGAIYRDTFVESSPWSDMKAFSIIKRHFPQDANLYLSNGTAVRYDQLFGIHAHATFCNRGVSGIDGCTSSAVGAALAYTSSIPEWSDEKGETILITGDMSFSYDLGALGSGLIPDTMKIIVLNNSGGGIFRYIGSTSALPGYLLERCFCADPKLNIKAVTEAFGLKWFGAETATQLENILPEFFNSREASLLEIKTDGKVSAEVLKRYMEGK